MVEIKEGPELDRAVAEAIGLICTHQVLYSDIRFWADPRDGTNTVPRTFNPSTNLNNAFHAAEVVGLFNDSHRVIHKDNEDGTWEVADIFANIEVILASEDTPSLAICAAILKVMEKTLK